MAYTAPTVDDSGLHIPTYQDIEDYLVENARSIFGQDIYLDNDSQDFQFIATLALVVSQTLQAVQLAYNSHSPTTAVGTGLDNVVSINGLSRQSASYSTCPVTLAGTPYTLVSNGIVGDENGNKWNLPESVTLDEFGSASTTATAQELGNITATVGQITNIITPTFGWASVTNPIAATAGEAQETNSELRGRQALSVANPSQAITTGILGAVLDVADVTQATLYENDTDLPVSTINGAYNPYDFPPHSITVVANGGDGEDIANAIWIRKTPGCYTDGDQEYELTDQYNITSTIRFWRPVERGIDVDITIEALSGYTSAIGEQVVSDIVDYINSLTIGQNVIISELWQAAMQVNSGRQYPYFSLTSLQAGFHGQATGTSTIGLEFNELAITEESYINLTVS